MRQGTVGVEVALPVSKATVTHHFRTLREAGLIQQTDRGNSRMACLRRSDIEARFPALLALLIAEAGHEAGREAAEKAAPSEPGE